jgi:hypothetical protein
VTGYTQSDDRPQAGRAQRSTPAEPYVFVCYAHSERGMVVDLVGWLRSQGFGVWFDENIEAGSRWSEDLARAVDGCAAFLFFMSPRSIASRYCLDEIHFALECGRPIVPVEVEPVTLTPGLRLSLGGTHRIFMYRMDAEEFRRKLASGLTAALEGGDTGHAIEKRRASQPARADMLAAASSWLPQLLGVFTALVIFVAMMLAGR